MASTSAMSHVVLTSVASAVPGTPVDDPAARRLLERAQGAFQKWPEDFAGFGAAARCRMGPRECAGRIWVRRDGRVRAEMPDCALAAWTEAALRDVVSRQVPRFFKDGDGRFPIEFGPGEQHPLGRLVIAHIGPAEYAAYRIDGKGRLRMEERVGAGVRSVTTVEEFVRATPGRVLPARLTRWTWDLRTGTLVESQSLTARHCRISHVWLPLGRVARRDGAEPVVLELSEHHVL